jgi:hypothetical protein
MSAIPSAIADITERCLRHPSALRTVQEYNEKVEYIHLHPVRACLVSRPEGWRWSSYNEYAGISAEEQKKRCGLIVDRVSMPSDPRARI